MLFPSHTLPLLSDFLPSISFSSAPLWSDAELWSTKKGAHEWESCKQSLQSDMHNAWLSHRGWKESKGLLRSPWRPVFLPLLGDSWPSGYFRLSLIGLLVYKALSRTLLHLILTITTGHLLFFSFYRWAKWSSQWLRNELTHRIRGKVWTWTQMLSLLYWCSSINLTPSPENNCQLGNTVKVHSSRDVYYVNFFLRHFLGQENK